MDEHPIEKLSEYIDGELSALERRRVESHLAGCPACASLVGELRAVVAIASGVEDEPPATDLWPGIEDRIGPTAAAPRVVPIGGRRARRFSFSLPQLAAASLAAALLSAAAVWTALREPDTGVRTAPVATAPVEPAAGGSAVGTLVSDGSAATVDYAEYEAAVADLERLLHQVRDQIDPATRAAIDQNLAIIDDAIRQTRSALMEDPNSVYLNAHLAKTMRRKIDVLRDATELTQKSI